jgi:hypothetical protein
MPWLELIAFSGLCRFPTIRPLGRDLLCGGALFSSVVAGEIAWELVRHEADEPASLHEWHAAEATDLLSWAEDVGPTTPEHAEYALRTLWQERAATMLPRMFAWAHDTLTGSPALLHEVVQQVLAAIFAADPFCARGVIR